MDHTELKLLNAVTTSWAVFEFGLAIFNIELNSTVHFWKAEEVQLQNLEILQSLP